MAWFEVPTGDDPNPQRKYDPLNPGHAARWPQYNQVLLLCNQVHDVSATFNSFKKNLLPNLERMGLVERRKRASKLGPPSARLTPEALEILKADATRQPSLVAEAYQRVFPAGFLTNLYELLAGLEFIAIYELQLVVSDEHLTADKQLAYVRAYRRLSRLKRLQLHEELIGVCAATMKAKSKVDKRDWGNWHNQAGQIMSMLAYVPGLKVPASKLVARTGTKMAGEFVATRASTVKRECLIWHGLEPQPGWELHHIVPIEYATSRVDLRRIDARENLIQLTKGAHRRIPTRNNRSVAFDFDATHVTLSNPAQADHQPQVRLKIGTDVRVNLARLPAMVEHNKKLLTEIS